MMQLGVILNHVLDICNGLYATLNVCRVYSLPYHFPSTWWQLWGLVNGMATEETGQLDFCPN